MECGQFVFFGYVYSVAQLAFHLGDKLRFSYLLEIYIFYLIYQRSVDRLIVAVFEIFN